MDEPSDRISRFLVFFIICVLIIKGMSGAGFFVAKDHKGRGYYVKIPPGWVKMKIKGARFSGGVDVTTFVPEGLEKKEGVPDVYIMIFSKKLSTPIWIADEFPDILNSLRKQGMDIKDKGEIKMDEEISKWVVYLDKQTPAMVLEFYIVTETSTFIKLQYATPPNLFNDYRRDFEYLRESFKLRFSLY